MIEHPLLLFVFILANLFITLGYLYLAIRVVPKIRVNLQRTKIGGTGFFLLCGATHLHIACTALFDPDMSVGDMASGWSMVAIHVPQAVCVWLFVTGLFIEVGSWASPARPRLDADTDTTH